MAPFPCVSAGLTGFPVFAQVYKVLKAKGKITPELDAHLREQMRNVPLPTRS